MADPNKEKVDHTSQIQEIVRKAKELESEGKLAECKHAYLDAASLSLEMAKTSNFVDKLSYENITKVLVQYARDIQDEINLMKDGPLPQTPDTVPSKKKSTTVRKPFDPNAGLQYVSAPTEVVIEAVQTKIHQIIAIKEGGLPILSYSFEKISEETTDNLNEILFSGAITAVNQLMQEVLDRPIQTITFEDGILLIRANKDIYYVLFADEDTEELSDKLDQFCKEFSEKMASQIEESVHTGMVLSSDQQVISLITQYFKA
jgi:hypothetical protein